MSGLFSQSVWVISRSESNLERVANSSQENVQFEPAVSMRAGCKKGFPRSICVRLQWH